MSCHKLIGTGDKGRFAEGTALGAHVHMHDRLRIGHMGNVLRGLRTSCIRQTINETTPGLDIMSRTIDDGNRQIFPRLQTNDGCLASQRLSRGRTPTPLELPLRQFSMWRCDIGPLRCGALFRALDSCLFICGVRHRNPNERCTHFHQKDVTVRLTSRYSQCT